MTRDQVLSFGFKPEQLHALSDYLKTNIPRPPRVADPTALVNNEGAMNGFLNAADMISSLAQPAEKAQEQEIQLYSEPAIKTSRP